MAVGLPPGFWSTSAAANESSSFKSMPYRVPNLASRELHALARQKEIPC